MHLTDLWSDQYFRIWLITESLNLTIYLKNIKETNLSIVVLVNVVLTAEEGFARNAIVVLLVFCIGALFTLSVANKVITLCEVHVAPSHVLLILRTKVSYS